LTTCICLGTNNKAKSFQDCFQFWYIFFDDHCQRPNNEIRLFPVNYSFKFIYEYFFAKWHEKLMLAKLTLQTEQAWLPSFSTFLNARYDPSFKDVTKRPRHYHALCKKCDSLRSRRLKGFVNDVHRQVWERLFTEHENEALNWRKLEGARETQARSGNGKNQVLLQYDDTGSLGLPKLTNRGDTSACFLCFHLCWWSDLC
jgi:hypothetical protein